MYNMFMHWLFLFKNTDSLIIWYKWCYINKNGSKKEILQNKLDNDLVYIRTHFKYLPEIMKKLETRGAFNWIHEFSNYRI